MNIDKVVQFIETTSRQTRVYVGCDSVIRPYRGRWITRYANVVVVHKDGCRGCRMFGKLEVQPDSGVLKIRLRQEAWKAAEIARVLIPHRDMASNPTSAYRFSKVSDV